MLKAFSAQERTQALGNFSDKKYDLVIVGGGITGAGVARDAASRGMNVALIEMQDFAQGTSSRSSKLIHGGIRYLENMEFKLVFEALSERTKLFAMAPHMVHPLRFMLPLYKGGRVGMLKMGLGMWLYDALSLFQAPEMHERLNVTECGERMPVLQQNELMGAYVYSDAYMDDDRLVFETLRSAHHLGADCANFCKATGILYDSNKHAVGVQVEDIKTGKKIEIHAKHVVSCVGPWTDEMGHVVDRQWKKILRPTKGVHLTFEKSRLPLSSAVVMAAEKRIVFGIPRHDMVIVGTTDTDFNTSPGSVRTDSKDVDYLLGVINTYFPSANIQKSDIVSSYAGVRPLVQDGSDSEGKTSREHTIFTDDHRVTYVAGGKYTTYRLMAEQIVKQSLKYFSIEEQVKFNRNSTDLPLNPLITEDNWHRKQDFVEQLVEQLQWSEQEAQWLVDRHGYEGLLLAQKYPDHSYWQIEARHALESTMCLHLKDFYVRRVPLFLAKKDHGLSVLQEVSAVFAHVLGWNRQTLEREIQELQQMIADELSWKNNAQQ